MGAVVLSTGIGAVTCTNAPPSAILVQSPDGTQVSLNINGAELTLGSTVYITAVQNAEMTIATIEGTAIVAALNATRIIQPGAQVRMPLGTDDGLHVVGPPSEPQPYDVNAVQRAPLVLLEREVQLPLPIAGPTVPPIGSTLATSTVPPATVASQVTGTPGACVPRSDWTDTYTVQRGDTLSTIARRFNVSLQDMQQGNCITNPDLIRVGQELHVPEQAAVTSTIQALTTGITPTATAANFRVDLTTLQPRQCTTIRWDVDNATAVYFEGQITEGHSSQEICPTETTVYTLMVVQPDGRQVPYTLTVQITAPPNATEEVS
jgi:LysM repeat protein